MNLRKNLPRLFLALSFLLSITLLKAHPSWGIVTTASGEIIFADVMHGGEGTIWKIDKKGKLSKLLKNYHAHSLSLDQQGILWAAANRYIEGVIEGDGEHVLTKIHPEGKTEELIRTREITSFAGGTNTVTSNGEIVFTHQNQVFKRDAAGRVELLVEHTFSRIVTLFTGQDGSIYITDNRHQNGSIFRISPSGKMELFASDLIEEHPKNPPYKEPSHNLLYGMAEDDQGRLYVANSGSRWVLKIDKDKKVSTFMKSNPPWFPVGITFHKETAYVMEIGFISGKGHLGPRILKIEKGKAPIVIADTDTPEKQYSKGSLESLDKLPRQWNRNIFFLFALIIVGIALWKRNHFCLLLPFLTLLSCNPKISQTQEIPELSQADKKLIQEYEQLKAPHFLQLSEPNEPGDKLLLIGQLVDRETGKPIPHCRTFLYHTTTEGEYEQRVPKDPTTCKINGELISDEHGRFFIKTILPADYPGKKNNRHIHATFYHAAPYNMDIFFEPFVTNGIRKWGKKSGHGVFTQLKKQGDGYFAFAKIEVPLKKRESTKKVGGPCEGCEAIFEYGNKKLGSTDTLPAFEENEPKIKISGIVYNKDQKTPAAGVILYIYHTNRKGFYETNGNEKGWGKRHGSIRGWVKTDRQGKYCFYTFRPAAYPGRGEPEHIHITIKEPDKNEYYLDEYVFDDDPLLSKTARQNLTNRGGSGLVNPTLENGILTVERNLILGLNIPNYEETDQY